MSKMEKDVTSKKEDISQIKTMMQMLIDNKEHGNTVARPTGPPKPLDIQGGGGA